MLYHWATEEICNEVYIFLLQLKVHQINFDPIVHPHSINNRIHEVIATTGISESSNDQMTKTVTKAQTEQEWEQESEIKKKKIKLWNKLVENLEKETLKAATLENSWGAWNSDSLRDCDR